MICRLCPRMCGAERTEDAGGGVCGMGTLPVLARAALHFDEEPVISVPGSGSGAVFFSGCQLKCAFCQNYGISHDGFGKRVSVARLKEIYQELIDQGAANINLVSATHFLPAALESLEDAPGVPVIWNSSGYERAESIRLLEGRVNVYLPDFKYALSEPAGKYSGAADYAEFAIPAITEMLRQTGSVQYDVQGMMTRGTIIRHLVIPGCTGDSLKVMDWIAQNTPQGTPVSIMRQYTPIAQCHVKGLNRRVTDEEYERVLDRARDLGLNAFVQEMESAQSKYIPDFNMK